MCNNNISILLGASDAYVKDVTVNTHPKNAKIDHRQIWNDILSQTDSLKKCAVTKEEFAQGIRPNPANSILLKVLTNQDIPIIIY